MLALKDGEYEVCIDSTLEDGTLTYGECYLPGRSADEVLISCHVCHPSLANDNLSGLTVATFLARYLSGRDLRYSYRFLFIPGTIGAITWLAQNQRNSWADSSRIGSDLHRGQQVAFTTRRAAAEMPRSIGPWHACLRDLAAKPHEILEFSPYGYDERQYCSPGFNLAVGCLMRSVWGTFPEYHTSADNLDFIQPEPLGRIASGMRSRFRCAGSKSAVYQSEPLLRTSAWETKSL